MNPPSQVSDAFQRYSHMFSVLPLFLLINYHRNQVKLFGEPLRVKKSSRDKTFDVGAKLFIGNLDADIDEEFLYHTFSVFGLVINSKVMREDPTNISKGYAFLSYDTFEAADAAIEAMNGQFLRGKRINVQYALKKDSKNERHGSDAERTLAQNNPMVEQRKNLQIPTQYGQPFPQQQMMYGMGYPVQYPGYPGYGYGQQ